MAIKDVRMKSPAGDILYPKTKFSNILYRLGERSKHQMEETQISGETCYQVSWSLDTQQATGTYVSFSVIYTGDSAGTTNIYSFGVVCIDYLFVSENVNTMTLLCGDYQLKIKIDAHGQLEASLYAPEELSSLNKMELETVEYILEHT